MDGIAKWRRKSHAGGTTIGGAWNTRLFGDVMTPPAVPSLLEVPNTTVYWSSTTGICPRVWTCPQKRWFAPAALAVIAPAYAVSVVPSFVSIAVGVFQDTSQVVLIPQFDLQKTPRFAAQDPPWLG